MAENRNSSFDSKIVIGLIVVVFGLLLLFRNMGNDFGYRLWHYWPVIFVILGLSMIVRPGGYRRSVTGAVLVLLGVLLILNNLEIIYLRWSAIWPIILIFVGLMILLGNLKRFSKREVGEDFINLSLILGGGEFKFESNNLKGGDITAIMGGGNIDLRNADIAGDQITIDIFALMGGVELRVPTSWQVVISGAPILGGMDDKTSRAAIDESRAAGSKRLLITGTAILGGIDVKN